MRFIFSHPKKQHIYLLILLLLFSGEVNIFSQKAIAEYVMSGLPPRSVVSVSIIENDTNVNATFHRNIKNDILLSPNDFIDADSFLTENDSKKKAVVDLLMLTQGWKPYPTKEQQSSIGLKYEMETEQSIFGKVIKTFSKKRPSNLHILIPNVGYQSTIALGNKDSFCLRGLDFPDGVPIVLQATNSKNKDTFTELSITDKTYPEILPLFAQTQNLNLPKNNNLAGTSQSENSDNTFASIIELPDITVKGRRLVPMNYMGFTPDRGFAEGDPIFESVPTLGMLVARLGLNIRVINGIRRITRNGRPTEIRLDNDKVSGYALEDILQIDPCDIKQIEYFLPSNYEVFGNLAGGVGGRGIYHLYGNSRKGGLLYIYTKSRKRPRYNKYSMTVVRQLGYKPSTEFRASARESSESSTTLYWNPSLIVDEDGKLQIPLSFVKPDKQYVITIEGVSNSGEIIHKQEIFEY